MTDKELTKHKRTVERLLAKWLPLLGLDRCTLTIEFSDVPKESDDGLAIIAETSASWQYNAGYVVFYLANFNQVKPGRIEMAVIHELIHIMVNEMRNFNASDGVEHEERVVCGLTDAIMRVADAHKG